jgi:hypothetical protein
MGQLFGDSLLKFYIITYVCVWIKVFDGVKIISGDFLIFVFGIVVVFMVVV